MSMISCPGHLDSGMEARLYVVLGVTICAVHTGAGNMFPSEITVVSGEEIMLRLTPNLNQTVCYLTDPHATRNYTLLQAGNDEVIRDPHIQYWGAGLESGECGARISNVTTNDAGYWRLTSLKSNRKKVVGVSKVTVIESQERNMPRSYKLTVGTHQDISLGPSDSEYCQMVHPGTVPRNRLMPGNCNLVVNKATKAVAGNWTALIGVHGRTREIPASIILSVEEEKLDVGWEFSNASESESINVYCNLRYSNKTVRFCRFLRLRDQVGFHLSDGLGSGRYSYFGNGLRAGDCGMTIERPSQDDYTMWQCILGVNIENNPMAAFMRLKLPNDTESSIQTFSSGEVLAVRDTAVTVWCRAEASLTYCWIRHPNGTHLFSLQGDYAGGECSITLQHSQFMDSGEWVCHMGTRAHNGEDLLATTHVRITESSLAADEDAITTYSPGNVTLLCHAVPLGSKLTYCRFVRPDGQGFNVNEQLTGAVLGRYYYHGDGLTKGQCGLLIHNIQGKDYGEWICAAQLEVEDKEATDIITISMPDGSLASIGLATAATLILAACGVGVVLWIRRRTQLRQSVQEQEGAAPEEMEMMPVGE